jgi:hypothetical protein
MSNNAHMTITLSESNMDANVSIRYANGRTRQKCISVEDLIAQLARQHTTIMLLPLSLRQRFEGLS